MKIGAIDYFALWHLDPYASKESASSVIKLESLLGEARDFFMLPKERCRLDKKMSIKQAIITLSSQLGMGSTTFVKDSKYSDSLPLLARHRARNCLVLLLPYQPNKMVVRGLSSDKEEFISIDEINNLLSDIIILFPKSNGDSLSKHIQLVKEYLPSVLILSVALLQLIFLGSFFWICFSLLKETLSVGYVALLLVSMSGIIGTDWFLNVSKKNFVMASLFSYAFLYERQEKILSPILSLKKEIAKDIHYFFMDLPYKYVFLMMVIVNFVLLLWWHSPLFYGLIVWLCAVALWLYYWLKAEERRALSMAAALEKQENLVLALGASFNMMVTLRGTEALFNRIGAQWKQLKHRKADASRSKYTAIYWRLMMPLTALLMLTAYCYWWQVSLSFQSMVLLIADVLLLGFSLGVLATGIGKQPLSSSTTASLKKLPLLPAQGRVQPVNLTGQVELVNVSYSYKENGLAVIKNATTLIEAKGCYQLSGKSGSGKSTLMKLMAGQILADSGQVLFDGQDVRSLKLDDLYAHFGIVRQESRLFSGTIYDNIVCNRLIAHSVLERLLSSHHVFDMILDLPMGLQSYVFLEAQNLSRAQTVVILLARALVGSVKILFMDEIFKGIDATEQKIIIDFLMSLNMTKIIVSHHQLDIPSCKIINVEFGMLKSV